MDASGEYKLVSEVALTAADYVNSDKLAFVVYVYNAGNALTVKDVSVYKGDLFNPAPVVPDTPSNPETPDEPVVPTGDSTAMIMALALISVASLAGVKLAKKER